MANFSLNLTDVVSLILWIFVVYAITKLFRLSRRGWLLRMGVSIFLIPIPYLLYIRFIKHFDIFEIKFSAESFSGSTGLVLLWAVIGFIVYNLILLLWPD
jgi:hypothetical protein